MNTLWLLLMIGLSGVLYIRFASHDLVSIHQKTDSYAVPGKPEVRSDGIVVSERFKVSPDEILRRANTVILNTPRTKTLTGSLEEGLITYVTRSRIFGFPDYTTISAEPDPDGSRLMIYGRLRFGVSDFDVNSLRVYGWLKALEALDELR